MASSCSLVYDLSKDQCEETSECKHFGADFACEKGLCVDRGTGAGATSGSSGSSGRASGGTNPTGGDGGTISGSGGTAADGGMSATSGRGGSSSGRGGSSSSGRGGSTSGSSGDAGAGDGGAPFVPECEDNETCFDIYGETSPRACVDGTCVELITEDCPIVLPLDDDGFETLKQDPLILGGFAPISEISLYTVPIYDFDLAIKEFNNATNGIFVAGGSKKKLAMVVCNPTLPEQDDLLVPARHLIDDLKVEAVVATLLTSDQQYVIEEAGLMQDTFFMLTLNSDRSLINLDDDGAVWSMLAGADALAVTYQPLVDMAITHLQNAVLPEDRLVGDARIAIVTATDERFLNDLGSAFRDSIRWNGNKNSTENSQSTPSAFVSVGTMSDLAAPTLDRTADVDAMLAINPHIIVGATEREMVKPGGIIDLVEQRWLNDPARENQQRPFYIVSPYVFGSPDMEFIRTNEFLAPLNIIDRLVGLGWPAAADPSVFQAFQGRFSTEYAPVMAGNTENFYDSAYFTIYAIAAADAPLSGEHIGNGMIRITEGDVEYEVGPNDMASALPFLKAEPTSQIKLIGTMGPPNWNSVGGRDDAASLWCVANAGIFQPDRYRYNESTGLLDGSFPINCFTFPAPPPS